VRERARLEEFTPDERRALEEFNEGLDCLTTPLACVLEWLACLGKGETPEKITAGFAGELSAVKDQLNGCRGVFTGLQETAEVLRRLAANDYTVQVTGEYPGIFGQLAQAANQAQDRVKNAVRILGSIAAGDFKRDLEDLTATGKRSENDTLIPAFLAL